MADETTILLDEIRDLLADAPGKRATSLARVENTLTTGYARALALDAERSRLERRIGEVTSDLARSGGSALGGDELSALVGRLTATDADLDALRSLLAPLREHARALRARAGGVTRCRS